MRLLQDNAIWKPPSGKALLAHQDAAYTGWLAPKNMTTCWIALDDTAADRGTIYYVTGSHLWPHAPAGGQFHAPDDWLGYLREVVPPGTEIEPVPIEVPAGGAAFHDGWTWHGSPPNERPDAERRSIICTWSRARRSGATAVRRTRSTAATGGRASASSTRRSSRSSGAARASRRA